MNSKRYLALSMTLLLAFVLWAEALYVSNDSITVAWDRATEGTTPETYRVVAVWEGVSGPRQEFQMGTTVDSFMILQRPRTGFFSVKVRAENDVGVSDWAVSTNPMQAIVNGLPMGWRIYFEIPAPGGGGIQ